MTDFLQAAAQAQMRPFPGLPIGDQLAFVAVTDGAADVIRAELVSSLGGETIEVEETNNNERIIRFTSAEADTNAQKAEASVWLSARLGCDVFELSFPGAPELALSPPPVPLPLSNQMRHLAVAHTDGLESATSLDEATALDHLITAGPAALLDRAEAALQGQSGPGVDRDIQAEALNRMRPVVEAMTSGDPLDDAPETRAVLEALVRLSGRPVMRVRTELLPGDVSLLGDWKGQISPNRATWFEFTDAVGRIDVEVEPGVHTPIGTGILLSDTSVLTNRHVMDWFARLMRVPDGPPRYHLQFPVSIIFDPEAQDAATRFDITDVKTAGAFPIGRRMHLGKLDAAVLEMATDNGQAEPPLPIPHRFRSAAAGMQIMVSGYPLEPLEHTGPDADDTPDVHKAFWDRLDALYGTEFGVQYLAPGEIITPSGAVPFDPNGWAFTHDATTLGGNSGSLILDLDNDMPLVGLHFSGEALAANYAHDYAAIRTVGDPAFDTSLLPGSEGG